jgi:hypothetical protein
MASINDDDTWATSPIKSTLASVMSFITKTVTPTTELTQSVHHSQTIFECDFVETEFDPFDRFKGHTLLNNNNESVKH